MIGALAQRVHREHLVLAAIMSLSWGTMVGWGYLSFEALIGVVIALELMALALLRPAGGREAGKVTWAVAAVVSATAAFRYVGFLDPGPSTWLAAVLVLSVFGVVALESSRARVAAGVAGIAAVGLLTALAWRWGAAGIDVFNGLQMGTSALLHGQNPYTPTFLAMFQTRPLHFVHDPIHFCYLPGALLLSAPGRAVGDVRSMNAVAFLALIAFTLRIAWTSPGGRDRSLRALGLCLAVPFTVAMVHSAWLDVFSVAGLAGWLALRRRNERWAIVLLVVALTVKPTVLIALVPMWLWSRKVRRETAFAIAGACVVTVPFVLMTGVPAFYQDIAGIYGSLGFRYDGLTLSAFWYEFTGTLIPVGVSVLGGVVLGIFALRRKPVELPDVLIAGAFLSTAGFLLAKQAFLNYYFIPAWLLILATASRGVALDADADIRLPALVTALDPRRFIGGRPRGARIPVTQEVQ